MNLPDVAALALGALLLSACADRLVGDRAITGPALTALVGHVIDASGTARDDVIVSAFVDYRGQPSADCAPNPQLPAYDATVLRQSGIGIDGQFHLTLEFRSEDDQCVRLVAEARSTMGTALRWQRAVAVHPKTMHTSYVPADTVVADLTLR